MNDNDIKQDFSQKLAEKTGINEKQARLVLDALGIDQMLDNYKTASKITQDDRSLSALGVSRGSARILPELSFSKLGLVLHDRNAAISDVAR